LRAAVLGEFGGLGLAIKGHLWSDKSWGYKGAASKEALTRDYVNLWRKTWQLKDDPGLTAVVYTQWTDVETECNGLLTYDRKVVKVDADQVAAAHRGQLPPPPKYATIVPTAQKEAVTWRYSTQKPSEDWTRLDFDDKAWQQGAAGFGQKGSPGAIRTAWESPDIWLRQR